MRLLLDTHVYLWMATDPAKLTATARRALEAPENDLLLGIASMWEITIKLSRGKLEIPNGSLQLLFDQLASFGVHLLPIQPNHLLELERLGAHHGDPFDRILIAQALADHLTLLTSDRQMARYGVPVIWR